MEQLVMELGQLFRGFFLEHMEVILHAFKRVHNRVEVVHEVRHICAFELVLVVHVVVLLSQIDLLL